MYVSTIILVPRNVNWMRVLQTWATLDVKMVWRGETQYVSPRGHVIPQWSNATQWPRASCWYPSDILLSPRPSY